MPDAITPVGSQIIPPDASKGIATLSGMLGLQQQRQQLQTGQYLQQTAQANAQQDQQKNGELAKAQALISGGVKSGRYDDGQGGLDRQKVANDLSAIGPYAQASAGQLLSQANEIMANKQAKQNLSDSQQSQIGKAITGVASDPNLTNDKVVDMWEALRKLHPGDDQYSRMITSLSTHIPAARPGEDPRQTLVPALQGVASEFTGEPVNAPITNAAGQILNRNRFSGALSGAPTGAPSGQPGASRLPGSGGGGGLNPTTSQVAGETVRQTGTGNADVDRANVVSDLQQASSAAIPLTKRIDQLAEDIGSGKVAKMISETGNYFGYKDINEARAQLNKDLGQVKGLAVAKAGSDSRAATILEGYPTDTTPTDTIHAAMDYIRGTARQNLARGQTLDRYKSKDPSVRGFQQADDLMTRGTDPLMHEFQSLPAAQRPGFYKRNFSTPQEAQDFKNKVNALANHQSFSSQ